MVIKILGSGCSRCNAAYNFIKQIVAEKNINAEIIKVEDINEVLKYGMVQTPAVVIDEKVVLSGKVPTQQDVDSWFKKL